MSRTNLSGTNLGPLTTTWTMPETCSLFMPPCSTCSQAFRAQSCDSASNGSPRDNTACWPPAKPGVTSPSWPFFGWGFYSPGLACPSGYTSACTAIYNQRPDWDTQFKLFEGETAVGCCPPGFACTNVNGNTCMLTVTKSTNVPTAYCDATDITDAGTYTFDSFYDKSSTLSGGTVTWQKQTMTLYAPMFQLNFKHPPAPSNKPTKKESGLSGGAKAGIGIGVALGVLAVIGSVAMLLLRRRKHEKIESTELASNEWKHMPVDPRTQAHEMPASSLVELPAEGDGLRRG
ncbi:hypothetical protein PT974_03858 [Cladobotryum mycophilum]|uniref:Uncharacterized protein n=1 Tax=Cladobotryum mycophilum TaxID=491253 RepID=A0ABR0SUN3_9HYPO